MLCCETIKDGPEHQVDQGGYSSPSKRTSLRRRVFSQRPRSGQRSFHRTPSRDIAAQCLAGQRMLLTHLFRVDSPTPKPHAIYGRGRPLVVAILTAQRRNLLVYHVATSYLLLRKHCSKETGTKRGQAQISKVAFVGFASFGRWVIGNPCSLCLWERICGYVQRGISARAAGRFAAECHKKGWSSPNAIRRRFASCGCDRSYTGWRS